MRVNMDRSKTKTNQTTYVVASEFFREISGKAMPDCTIVFDSGKLASPCSEQSVELLGYTCEVLSPYLIIWFDPSLACTSCKDACLHLMLVFLHAEVIFGLLINVCARNVFYG